MFLKLQDLEREEIEKNQRKEKEKKKLQLQMERKSLVVRKLMESGLNLKYINESSYIYYEQRDRFKSAMNQFGYGRWKQISELTKAPGRSIEEIQAFGESMLFKLLGVQVSPENDDANFYETAVEETVEDCKIQIEALKSRASKEATSYKVTIESDIRSPVHATDAANLKFTGVPPQEFAPFIGFHLEDEVRNFATSY